MTTRSNEIERVAAEALARLPQLVEQWFPEGRWQGREYRVGDLDGAPGSSLSINTETGRWADFAAGQSGGDPVSLYAAMHRPNGAHPQLDAARALAEEMGMQGDAPPPAARRSNGKKASKPLGAPVATYDYTNEAGTLLYQVVRYDPKDFRQRAPDGAGGWTWSLKDVRRVLYRLPDLIAADPERWVLLVEGEKDANRLAELGFVATTNCGGASKWRREYTEALCARRVAILPDNDDPGRKHAAKIAQALAAVAGEVRIVTLPDLPMKGDVSDWLAAGGTDEILHELVEATPLFESDEGDDCVLGEPVVASKSPVRYSDATAEYGFDYSEDALALDLVSRWPNARYVAAWGAWYCWNGKRWAEDTVLTQYSRTRDLCREWALQGNDPRRAVAMRRASFVAGVVQLARADRRYAARVGQWDLDAFLLNTPAGIVDLETGRVLGHDPGRYQTKMTRGRPLPGDWRRQAPVFARFLEQLTPDPDAAAYIQRIAGYGCTGSAREHVLPFLLGAGGEGKTTLVEAIAHALGDYAAAMPPSFLAERTYEEHSTELADLRGVRFAYSSETSAGSFWNEARLKLLTGGDTIKARRMRADFFTFEPSHTLLVLGNNPPRLRTVDQSTKRRIQILPFRHRVARPDLALPEKLKGEADGILAWAIEGARAWIKDGLQPPAVVQAASAEYFDSQDLIGEWIEAECVTGPELESPITPLFDSYRRFCNERGIRPIGRGGLGDELVKRGFTRCPRSSVARGHHGIALLRP